VITSVGQEYEFTESQHDYKIEMGTIFGGQGAPMDISLETILTKMGNQSVLITTYMDI